MKQTYLLLIVTALALTACGPSRPTYSGVEASTEGVPGFEDGKKVSPHVKLGQSYKVDGEWHVPRHQPGYVEEGMASWYGPGFHGGKTANGEQFDKYELTAAHRTLPLPSIVRVTLLSTGKQVVVRVNDRGPFAHSRIIDLSRAAAEKIGLLQAGVGKVRVEYMKAESERFTELLGQGREPKSIDVASEVLNYTAAQKSNVARGDVRVAEKKSAWERVNPIASAQAAEPSEPVEATDQAGDDASVEIVDNSTDAAVTSVSASDLPGSTPAETSPFDAVETAQPAAPTATPIVEVKPKTPAPVAADAYYVQLGAFLKMENAQRVQSKFKAIDRVEVAKKPNAKNQVLYHVRMGPYASEAESKLALEKVHKAGSADARVVHE